MIRGPIGDVFCGVWASNRLPSLLPTFRRPAFFIVNTHLAHKPGKHWLALTLEENNEATILTLLDFRQTLPITPTVF